MHLVEALNKALGAARRLTDRGEQVTPSAIATESGQSEEDVDKLLNLPAAGLPLDEAIILYGEEALHAQYDREYGREEPYLFGYTDVEVADALGTLSVREELVIRRRYGFAGEPATLDDIGRDVGVTRERIRQIEPNATRGCGTFYRAAIRPIPRRSRTPPTAPGPSPPRRR